MTENGRRTSLPFALIAAAFLLHLLPFVARPALLGGDEPHYALAAYSLATDLDLDLADDYDAVADGARVAGWKLAGKDLQRHVVNINGRRVFAHPIGLPMLAAPLVAVSNAINPDSPPDVLLGVLGLTVTFAGLATGWRLLRDLAGCGSIASSLVFGVYFGSPLWYYSRTFFTESYTWAFAVLAISALSRRRFVLAGLFLALTLAMKETALLLVLPILIGTLALQGIGVAVAVALGPALFAVAFAGKNLLLTGRPFSTFQPFESGDFWSGVWGLLFDPTQGLIWFAPLLGIGMIGWFLPPQNRRHRWLDACCLLAFAGYFALTAAWVDWRGGSSYATRLLLPALPALAVPLLRLGRALPRRLAVPLLGSLATLGFAINFCAVIDPFSAFWNASAVDLVAGRPLVFGGIMAITALAMLCCKKVGTALGLYRPV